MISICHQTNNFTMYELERTLIQRVVICVTLGFCFNFGQSGPSNSVDLIKTLGGNIVIIHINTIFSFS